MNLESDWLRRREAVALTPAALNFNAGSCSPTCRPALAAQLAYTREQAENPVEFVFRKAPKLLEETRAGVASLVGAAPESLLLFNNATYGVNTVARSLGLKPGDEVVLCDQEYGHYLVLWRRIAAETGAKIVSVTLPLPGGGRADASEQDLVGLYAAALTPRTKLLFFSHVTSPTGLILPAAALCKLARDRGVRSFVDGAHALGLVPVWLPAMQPDYYAANLHKWMMGPVGTAFLYVAPPLQKTTLPLVTTGTFAFDPAKAAESVGYGGPSHWIFSHEYQGTRDYAPLLAAKAAVEFHNEVPLAEVTARWQGLVARVRAAVAPLGFAPASHAAPELATCMVAFAAPTPGGKPLNAIKATRWLRDVKHLELAFPAMPDGRILLRVAAAWFNTADEIDRMAGILKETDWAALV